MGFGDLLKKIGGTAQKALDNMAKNKAYREKVVEAKRELLSRFTMDELRRIAVAKKIELRAGEEDPFGLFQSKKRAVRTKNEVIEIFIKELSFNDIVDLARRYKKKYKDITEDLEEFKKNLYGTSVREKETNREIRKIEQEREASDRYTSKK